LDKRDWFSDSEVLKIRVRLTACRDAEFVAFLENVAICASALAGRTFREDKISLREVKVRRVRWTGGYATAVGYCVEHEGESVREGCVTRIVALVVARNSVNHSG